MKSAILSYLRDLELPVLEALLEESEFRRSTHEDFLGEAEQRVEILSSPIFSEALNGMRDRDKQRIIQAIQTIHSAAPDDAWSSTPHVSFRAVGEDPEDAACLLPLLVCQRNTMIDVATGGARFDDVDDSFRVRQKRVSRLLVDRGLENPNNFGSLWDWYRHWQDAGLGSWAERRTFVDDLYEPILAALVSSPPAPIIAPRPPSGWPRVDRTLSTAKKQLATAENEEDYQAVGLLCREVLISLGQAVFNPSEHKTIDGVEPSPTDARRQLEGFLASTVSGKRNEGVRRHANAALALTLELQHRRTADQQLAQLCVEATASVVAVVSILSGRWKNDELGALEPRPER